MTRQVGALLGYVLLYAILLFGPARTLDWPAAWTLLVTLLVVRGIGIALLWRRRRALLHARTFVPLPQAGQPLADRILLPSTMAALAGQLAFAAWDLRRLHFMPQPLELLRYAGLAVFIAGWWVVYRALWENEYALTVVRLQRDRAQDVVDTGPYSLVRHPMYSGILVYTLGLPLWLGSWAAVAAAAAPMILLAVRIVFEERLLKERLDGYSDYTHGVRWRLIPGIW